MWEQDFGQCLSWETTFQKQSFNIKSSAAQTTKCWTADHQQHIYAKLYSDFIPHGRLCVGNLQLQPEDESQAIHMSKIDEEDFEIGKKVVELLQKQFAKTALTTHKHAEILDILQDSQQTIAQVSSRT